MGKAPHFRPGGFHGLYSQWGHKELDTTERLSFHLLHDSTESIFYFLVSKTVYEWIQHGDDNSVKTEAI